MGAIARTDEHALVVLPGGDIANQVEGFRSSSWQTSKALKKLSHRKSGAELFGCDQARLTVM